MVKRTLLEEIAEAERHACVSMAVSLAELKPLVQALADVRTLDDWAKHTGRHWAINDEGDDVTGPYWCVFTLQGGHMLLGTPGQTPDEARAKAAAWVREQKP